MPTAQHDPEPDPEPIRAKLRLMTDAELVKHGRKLVALCNPHQEGFVSPTDVLELREARLDWLRRKAERRKANR